ncbi:MAG: hypothetical protein KGZ85_11055 [Ignavibacterium sp.]|nr:hypothetical protein [Ignavibacterium sp.]
MNKFFISGALVIIIFLLYNFILAFGSLEGTPQKLTGNLPFPYLTEKPLTEDGYYMLTVAWNIAEGNGFTYNYGVRTTGVQPLATMLYSVPAYLVQNFGGDKYDFARAIIIFSALLQIIFAFLVFRLAVSISKDPDRGLYFLVSVCVMLFNFKVLLNFANGLETGLYLILLSLFFLYWIKFNEIQPGLKQSLGLGLLSGLLLLCRLDSVVILFTFYILLFFTGRIKFRQLAVILLVAFLLYLPWQLYIWDVTGSILQSSARSQTGLFPFFDLASKLEQYFASIIQHFTPFLYTGNLLTWLMFLLGLPYIIFLFVVFSKKYQRYFSNDSKNILIPIAISFSVLVIVYFFFSTATHFYFRYTAYLMVFSFPVIVVLFSRLLKKLFYSKVLMVFLVVLAIFGIQAFLYLHSGKAARVLTERLEFVKNNFSADERIAALQTGILGYFYQNVFNLDGKMDNFALMSMNTNQVSNYLDSLEINVLMEWKDFIPQLLDKDYLEKEWELYSDDIGDGRTMCYVRKNTRF